MVPEFIELWILLHSNLCSNMMHILESGLRHQWTGLSLCFGWFNKKEQKNGSIFGQSGLISLVCLYTAWKSYRQENKENKLDEERYTMF